MVTEQEIQAALEKLTDHGGYDWIINDTRAFWSVSQVVDHLNAEGMQISNDLVLRWFRGLDHTQNLGGTSGMRASRNDLILFFARQMNKA